jgi:protein-export membrane protein SecD
MNRSWWAKLLVLVAFVGLSGAYVFPTLAGLDLEKTRFPVKQKVNLGLDLQGGLYLVLGVDFKKVYQDVLERQLTSLLETLKEKNIAIKSGALVREAAAASAPASAPVSDDPRIRLELVDSDSAKRQQLVELLKKDYWTLRLTDEKPEQLELGLSREYKNEVREGTLSQSIEVIRNRVDEFGVAEPAIASQGTDRVVVELPGVKEVERAKELIGRTAKLEFRIVNDKALDEARVAELVAEIEKANDLSFDPRTKTGQKFSDYVARLNELARDKIPADSEIAFERIKPLPGMEEESDSALRRPYLLFRKTDVTGADLQDAQVTVDPENRRPVVSFTLNPRGADLFDKLTGDHIRDRLAIVLDGIVHSAPVIQSRIGGGRGQISLGQDNANQLMKEAKDLAIVLRAGALPAQLDFLEQRVVGPSLGQDSIQKGARAGVVGCVLIFIFMIFYYRMSGVVASVSLLLNALFLLAILVGIEATLTLPGIAGIALTIGMAVDSNVIIFERIRDELTEGKSVATAVQAGFDKAFSAIFDANITHGIIAVILMTYGTGPIRGFATTLLIGIATTLFCAVTVCKLFFDGYLARRPGLKTLSI